MDLEPPLFDLVLWAVLSGESYPANVGPVRGRMFMPELQGFALSQTAALVPECE